MKTAQYLMQSKIGPLYLVASEKGLQGVFWKQQSADFVKSLKGDESQIKFLSQAIEEIESYLQGQRTEFNVSLDIRGTAFQMQVWEQLRKIPYGKTYSYSDIANKIKNPKAVRAVGTANGKNPLSLIIPCHRVIAADGTLGGYAGGLDIKSKLLEMERKQV